MLNFSNLIICVVLGLFSILAIQAKAEVADDHDWDKIILSQQWPITTCIDHKTKKSHAQCVLFTNVTSWTVHGLWPTLSGTKGPVFCNKSWPFDLEKIATIEPSLLKYWSNIFADTSTASLWKHEWLKHGTCAAEIEQLDDEYNYFKQGVQWAINYDILSILEKWKIYPNDKQPYRLNDIFGVIKYHTGFSPIIDCIYNKKTKLYELSQIKLCFNRQLHLVDCTNESDPQKINSNCPRKGLMYPSSVKV